MDLAQRVEEGSTMTGTVFTEDMTWPEVRDAIAAGTVRVIVIVAAMEQHGPHLAEWRQLSYPP